MNLDQEEIERLYDGSNRKALPHVVKFSGGRSSGMLLKIFLDNGLLKSERGDVVIFNNTSAEHPATYEFVKRCTEYAENEWGIPFFWIEFATYEDVYGGEWIRSPTYKLVNRHPCSSDNPDGFHSRGEVFEEMVSYQGFLPSRTTRTCTTQLKLEITSRFLAEWFACKHETLRRGHFHQSPQITDDSIFKRHQKARGSMKKEMLIEQRAYVRSRPFVRESQKYDEFTNVKIKHIANTEIVRHSLGDYTSTDGPDSLQFLSLIGLRNDERSRVYRVLARNKASKDSHSRKSTYMLDGEIIGTPLSKLQISKQDVFEYWSTQDWDLSLPDEANLSNCVFCFNKGSVALSRISKTISNVDESLPNNIRSVDGTPTDVNWWINLEEKYKRIAKKSKKTDGEATVRIGMWGVDAKTSYRSIRDAQEDMLIAKEPASAIPCDCTD